MCDGSKGWDEKVRMQAGNSLLTKDRMSWFDFWPSYTAKRTTEIWFDEQR